MTKQRTKTPSLPKFKLKQEPEVSRFNNEQEVQGHYKGMVNDLHSQHAGRLKLLMEGFNEDLAFLNRAKKADLILVKERPKDR